MRGGKSEPKRSASEPPFEHNLEINDESNSGERFLHLLHLLFVMFRDAELSNSSSSDTRRIAHSRRTTN